MTELFVVCSFYLYFVLFLVVEFVITRSRLGSKGVTQRIVARADLWV